MYDINCSLRYGFAVALLIQVVTAHTLTCYLVYQSDFALIKLIAAISCIAFRSVMFADIPNAVIIPPSAAYRILGHDSAVRGVIPMLAESAYFPTHFYIEPPHHMADLLYHAFLARMRPCPYSIAYRLPQCGQVPLVMFFDVVLTLYGPSFLWWQ
ncbi:MAG: hypothetical protein IJU00_15650 [Selenomonas sp.]|nr:hypothetical protein [Selenomonas sp.]